ncbi:hypothetical protein LCGC14_2178330, partial [marine sediment metagenome]
FKAIAESDEAITNNMSNFIADLLTTPGESGAARVAAVIAKKEHEAFFRLVMGAAAVGAETVGTELQRTRQPAESLLKSIEELRARRDATRTRG